MDVIEFSSAQVERVAGDAAQIVIALFDGTVSPVCVALLACSVESAIAFHGRLGSVLETLEPQ